MQPKESKKQKIWVEPLSKHALTAAVEAGCTSFVFRDRQQADAWSSLAMFTPMYVQDGSLVSADSKTIIARWAAIATVEEQQLVMQLAGEERIVVLDAADWKIIPAENLIAAFQVREEGRRAPFLVVFFLCQVCFACERTHVHAREHYCRKILSLYRVLPQFGGEFVPVRLRHASCWASLGLCLWVCGCACVRACVCLCVYVCLCPHASVTVPAHV